MTARPGFRLASGSLAVLISFCVTTLPSYSVPAHRTAPKIGGSTARKTPPGQSAINRPINDKWALVVGIGEFEDSKIRPLKYAAADARAFYKYLIRDAHFAPDHVRLLINEKAKQRRILSELGSKFLARVARQGDLVVIYISTHGSAGKYDERQKNYIIAHDTDPTDLYVSGIQMQQLLELVQSRVLTDRVVLVLDACHSGASDPNAKSVDTVGNFDARMLSQGSGQLVICSSKPHEKSYESTRYNNGIFTMQLLQGLRSGGGKATLRQAFNYAEQKVQNEVREDEPGCSQNPTMYSAWNGNDLILSAPAASRRSIPESVKTALLPDSSHDLESFGETQKNQSSSTVLPSSAVAVAAPPAASSPAALDGGRAKVGDKWAVVVGVSKMKEPLAQALKYASKDAFDFARYLTTSGNFAPDHVNVVTDNQATRLGIMDAVRSTMKYVMPDDLVVLFYSSMGGTVNGKHYLVATDTTRDTIESTGVLLTDLTRELGRANKCAMFLDAGAPREPLSAVEKIDSDRDAPRPAIHRLPASTLDGCGYVLVSACSPGQMAYESKSAPNGIFTRHLIHELEKAGTEASLADVLANVRDMVQAETRNSYYREQIIQVASNWRGPRLALAAPPIRPRKVPSYASQSPMPPSQPARNVDFGSYMADLERRIKRAWFPPKGLETMSVTVVISISNDGSLTNVRMVKSSGNVLADAKAMQAIQNAAPFRPLPAGSPASVDIQFNLSRR